MKLEASHSQSLSRAIISIFLSLFLLSAIFSPFSFEDEYLSLPISAVGVFFIHLVFETLFPLHISSCRFIAISIFYIGWALFLASITLLISKHHGNYTYLIAIFDGLFALFVLTGYIIQLLQKKENKKIDQPLPYENIWISEE